MIFKPDLVAHFGAERRISFPRYAGGHGAGGHASWLQHDVFFILSQAGFEQHLGYLGGFAGTGGRDNDQPLAVAQSPDDLCLDFRNRTRRWPHRIGQRFQKRKWRSTSATRVRISMNPAGMNFFFSAKRHPNKTSNAARTMSAT